MDEFEVVQRYALALTAVPDEDVAGDLFMDANSDADLLRRANAWRRRNGLEPIDMPALLPALSEGQREHALYLASRGRKRRRTRRALAVSATCLALVAAVGFGAKTAVPRGLATDPTFRGNALQTSDAQEGRKLSIYKAEATATEITVWWELRGPGTGELAGNVIPEVKPEGAQFFTSPTATEVTAARRDRLLGKSTYQMLVTVASRVDLRIAHEEKIAADWQVSAPLELRERSVTIPLNQQAKVGETLVQIESLEVSPEGTWIRYSGSAAPGQLPQLIGLEAEGRSYRIFKGTGYSDGKQSLSLGPLRPGTTGFTLQFLEPPVVIGTKEYPLLSPEPGTQVQRQGATTQATITFDSFTAPQGQPYFWDNNATSYPASYRLINGMLNGGGSSLIELTASIPPDRQPISVILPGLVRPGVMVPVNVNLGAFLSR